MDIKTIDLDNEIPTTKTTIKDVARAFAPVAISLAVGIGCGILVEKMKNRPTATEA